MKYLLWSKFIQKNLLEKFIFLICIFLLAGFNSNVFGQIKPLDNGDLEVVNKKNLQSETYFDFSKRGPSNTNGINTLLRYGISKNIELQVDWTGVSKDTISESFSRVGVKAYLVDESKYLPGISLIGSFNLTASPSNNPLMPSLNILYKKSLVSNFTLTGNVNFILDEQNNQLSNEFAANLDVELTNWLTSYIGVRGVKSYSTPLSERANYQEYFQFGMLFWIADGFRIYPFYDLGFAAADDDIINIGVIYHFK